METILETVKESLFFNDLLKMAGINPGEVKIYRHKGEHLELGKSIYNVCLENPEEFESFQSDQSARNPFSRKYLASFVETPSGETVLVGIYEIQDRILKPNADGSKYYWYDHKKTNHLLELNGRIFVNWDEVYRGRQSALCSENYNFKVVKIRGASEREAFPGFHDFLWRIDEIDKMPEEWKDRLKNWRGVYLLTCTHNEFLYVGSASGERGFFGRWQNYMETDDGGNKLLIQHNRECKEGYQVSILEISSSSDTRDDIIRKENSWKAKLLTRGSRFGLNLN